MNISKKFKKICLLYKHFSKDWEHLLDYSNQAMFEAFQLESFGKTKNPLVVPTNKNGYIVGKKWMDVQIAS